MRALAVAFVFVSLGIPVVLFFYQAGEPTETFTSVEPSTVRESDPVRHGPDTPEANPSSRIERAFLPGGGCLTEKQLFSHPRMAQEAARLAPFSTRMSEEISAYRGLTEKELLPLIRQGDSAAMAVMGAIEVMRASGEPDDKAVPYLMVEDRAFVSRAPPTPADYMQHYENAAEWFYEAALHGRVLALVDLGIVMSFQRKTPLELGLITEEDLSSATIAQQSTLDVSKVYQGLAYTIAPELEIGFFAEGDGLFGTRAAEQYSEIIQPLYAKFEQDRVRRGLPPVIVPESTLPPLSELEGIICQPAE